MKSPCTIGESGSHGIECEDSNEPSFNETSEMSFKPVTNTASWIKEGRNLIQLINHVFQRCYALSCIYSRRSFWKIERANETNKPRRSFLRAKQKEKKGKQQGEETNRRKKNIHGNKVELKRPDDAEDYAVEPLLGKEEQCRQGEVGL